MALSHQIGRDATAVKAHARAAAAILQAATDGCDGCMCESCIPRISLILHLGVYKVCSRDLSLSSLEGMRSSVLDLEPCAGAEETASGAREIRRMDSEYIPKKTQPLRYKSRRESSSLGQCHDTRVHETHKPLKFTVRVKNTRAAGAYAPHAVPHSDVLLDPASRARQHFVAPGPRQLGKAARGGCVRSARGPAFRRWQSHTVAEAVIEVAAILRSLTAA